jgi:hypothetical protein
LTHVSSLAPRFTVGGLPARGPPRVHAELHRGRARQRHRACGLTHVSSPAPRFHGRRIASSLIHVGSRRAASRGGHGRAVAGGTGGANWVAARALFTEGGGRGGSARGAGQGLRWRRKWLRGRALSSERPPKNSVWGPQTWLDS